MHRCGCSKEIIFLLPTRLVGWLKSAMIYKGRSSNVRVTSSSKNEECSTKLIELVIWPGTSYGCGRSVIKLEPTAPLYHFAFENSTASYLTNILTFSQGLNGCFNMPHFKRLSNSDRLKLYFSMLWICIRLTIHGYTQASSIQFFHCIWIFQNHTIGES